MRKFVSAVVSGTLPSRRLLHCGYSSALLCRSCGNVEVCEQCSISLTYHRDWNHLVCHYCGSSRSLPQQCPQCSKQYLHLLGEGTEKIQEILCELFSRASIDRLDRDTVQRKGSAERILGAFSCSLPWTTRLASAVKGGYLKRRRKRISSSKKL